MTTPTIHRKSGETVTTSFTRQQPNLQLVDLSGYTRTIFKSIIQLENLNPGKIALRVYIQKIWLTGDQTLHCLMLIYFLLAYMMKYTFPKNRTGSVYVSLYTKQEAITLVVRGDGVTMPINLKSQDQKSQNLMFVYRLVKELNGIITVGNGPGNRFEILFPSEHRVESNMA
jgi:two-component sensor histidine kinase